jgi:putative FmdB family regulatory protein
MPIYEYRCKKCKKEFEALVRADDPVACPACSSKRVEKLLSTFSAVATGSTPNTACGVDAACGSACCSGGSCPMSGAM